MSIFGKIASAIFGSHKATMPEPIMSAMPAAASPGASAQASPPSTPAFTPGPDASVMATRAASAAPMSAAPAAAPATVVMTGVDVAAVLDGIKAKQGEALDWRKSIVDLMKLLKLDSSLSARKELAHELAYSGDMGDSAAMNVWLHKQVMTKLAENGGIVPAELKH